VTSSRSARRARRNARRGPEPRTEPIPRLRTADYDATTIEFTGASDIGLPETDVAPAQAPPGYGPAPTGPMRALDRPAVSIGDALTHDDTWGPKLAPLPCGHCATPPPVPDTILERTRIIGHVNWLAARAGWAYDVDLTWTCPDCQQGEAWKARQGQLELHRFGEYCDRHDAPPWADVHPDECRCTCPGAVVAVDVMLRSEDYLGSGRGRHAAGRR
jgi:hypothetical protein